VTRRGTPARTRVPRDPYGIGPVAGYVGPALGVVALVLIGALTLSLFNGQIPFLPTAAANDGTGNGGTDGGPGATAAPSNVIVVVPKTAFPGSIVYAKAGNIWVQSGSDVKQLTSSGNDSMPTFSADGKSIYFIRIQEGTGKFPTGGNTSQGRSWYDLDTPGLYRMNFDGSGAQRLLYGRFIQGGSAWFYWLRQPVPSPDGKTIVVVSDGPNPLQSDIVLHSFNLKTKKLTSLNLTESLHLGQQDPAWRPDGKYLLFVKNGRELTRGAPQIYRYDPASNTSKAVTGPGYLSPAYSPDGAWIAATHTDAFGTDIAILDQAGKEVLRVTDDAHSFAPIWSPAGNAIAFLHLEGTIVDLRMAMLDDATGQWVVKETVDLTKVSALDGASRPSWYIPPSELPAASPAPDSGASPSAGTSTAP
jgi:Tol biopolymer transport system component